jgi:hypothetical protein
MNFGRDRQHLSSGFSAHAHHRSNASLLSFITNLASACACPMPAGSTWSVHAGLYVIFQGRTIAHAGARPKSHVESLLLAAFQLSFRRRVFLADTGKPCGSLRQLHTVLGHRHLRKGRQGDRRGYGLHCSHLHFPFSPSSEHLRATSSTLSALHRNSAASVIEAPPRSATSSLVGQLPGRIEVRSDVSALGAASPTNKSILKVGQPDVTGPSVTTDCRRMAVLVVGAIVEAPHAVARKNGE